MKTRFIALTFFALASCSKEQSAAANGRNTTSDVSQSAQIDKSLTPELDSCMDNVGLGEIKNTQFVACYEKELVRADAKLNSAYRDLKISLSTPDMIANLTKAQRSWIVFRDDFCQFEMSRELAPSPAFNRLSCIVDLTREQASRLQETK